MTRTFVIGAVAWALLLQACGNATAQPAEDAAKDFPNRTVTVIGYSNPGGPLDLLARLLAEGLKAKYPRPVIVENRTGAAGITASLYLRNQPADGHTLLYGTMTTAVFAPQIRPQIPYDTRKDFTPVALTVGYTLLLVANESVPFNTLTEMVAYTKANPGKLNYGTNGFGAWTHIAMELFKQRTGANLVHVPFTGHAPAIQALLAGDIQLAMVDINIAMQHIQAGKLRVVGQLGAERTRYFPNAPTFGESVPELATPFWLGIFGPPAMPAPLVKRLNGDINAVMESPAMRQKLEDSFMQVQTETPDAFAGRVAKDWVTWGQVIRENNLIVR
jgi:tripartite-type tricarboxylate transporter receptor subunit TctC